MSLKDKIITQIVWISLSWNTLFLIIWLFKSVATCAISMILYVFPCIVALLILHTYPICITYKDEIYPLYWKDIMCVEDILIVSFTATANIIFVINHVRGVNMGATLLTLSDNDEYIEDRMKIFIENENKE